jgi:IS4 transposase
MAEYLLDTDLIARFVFALLPHKPTYRLALDRTNWKFGTTDINILVLAIVYQGLAIPILYTMMPKFGNSSTAERIDLIRRYIQLFGIDTIDCLLGDREFVGDQWLAYLNNRRIRYHLRIRENFWIDIPKNGHRVKASWFFNHLKINQYEFNHGIVYIKGQLYYLSASKVRNKDRIPKLQIIASFNKPDEAHSYYKERWQIESAFKALRTSGFNIDDTHLTDLDRVEKLFALVLVAFIWLTKSAYS